MLTEKRMHNLKVENYFLFGELSENLSPEDSLSALRDCSKHKRGARVFGVFATKPGGQNIRILLLIKKTRHL